MVDLLKSLDLEPFRPCFPWLGPDLQTLRDTFQPLRCPPETGRLHPFPLADGGRLLARLDAPAPGPHRGLVVVVHGLGGSSDDGAQRRLGRALNAAGFSVLRLNLRGAGPGRPQARGTYAAGCSEDLLPVLGACRRLLEPLSGKGPPLPLAGVGISLGGTVLLNALLDGDGGRPPPLDAVVGISSPLDLSHCAAHFERPRNRLYQGWMMRRLIQQTLDDPHPLSPDERMGLTGPARPRTIRDFDALITAPRWGFADVAAYYAACSPLSRLRQIRRRLPLSGEGPPPLLLVHAMDDPWVPVEPTLALAEECGFGNPGPRPWPDVVITGAGGHCGFHAAGDGPLQGRWRDRLMARWLLRALGGAQGRSTPEPVPATGPSNPTPGGGAQA